ncbi:hypothetical protein FRC01_005346 [Tulasnella sp. 417]|nr:hypothetical protein FRC01_005346 [Tulasnella sp. 417]
MLRASKRIGVVSLVSRYWRDLVEKSACLWTDISGHDYRRYIKKSLFKSRGLLIDIHYMAFGPYRPHMNLTPHLNIVLRQLSRCRSITLITETCDFGTFWQVFDKIQRWPAPFLESLTLKGAASRRRSYWAGYRDNFPKLPGTPAFPKLRCLEVDGVPCNLSPPGLKFSNVLSLNLVEVESVSMEQLLDVFRNSPFLERLELGGTPDDSLSQEMVPPVHLPRLKAFHLIFQYISVSNFFLSTIHAPNCSEIFISAYIPDYLNDGLRRHLFTRSTDHFSPVLQKLLTRGLYNDIELSGRDGQLPEFRVRFHDKDSDEAGDKGFLQFQFRFDRIQPIEETVHWLASYFKGSSPKIPTRLHFTKNFEEVRLMDIIEPYTSVTHFAIRILFNAPSNPILAHLAQPTSLGWPLPDLEDFTYGRPTKGEPPDEVLLDMLRRRYGSSSEQIGIKHARPRPLKRIRLVFRRRKDISMDLLDKVHEILPTAEMFVDFEPDDSNSIW